MEKLIYYKKLKKILKNRYTNTACEIFSNFTIGGQISSLLLVKHAYDHRLFLYRYITHGNIKDSILKRIQYVIIDQKKSIFYANSISVDTILYYLCGSPIVFICILRAKIKLNISIMYY
jgi:hypothetical protein